ncbi:MAG: hypothetical protein CMI55_00105 [Parcubacteria group bacterium]|nr:hypothetical protein [Parcubacteria group bacterium]|tara:strand:+ start:3787 stop:5577 length:1791 start_codon:yes stop_codon:yes gene_type:complete
MKKILILFLIVSLIAVGIGSVFAMTQEVSIPKLQAFAISLKGDVAIRKNNSEEWVVLEKGQELISGDEIKTGQDGQVSINFYDTSISQIGPNSQVRCDELFIDDYNYAKTKVSLIVTTGRVWSRIIKLSDQEAVFEVSSDKTVATVRGTIFDFEVTADGMVNINAVEDIVEVSTIKIKEEIDEVTKEKKKEREIIAKVDLLEGLAATIDQRKETEELKRIETEIIPEAKRQSEWFENNIENEERFIEEIEKKQAEVIEKIAGRLPDSKLYGFKKVTENIRLAVTVNQEAKEELEMRFASRRLAEAQELVEMGKNELAQEAINEFHDKAEQLFEEPEKLEQAGADTEKIEQIRNKINNQINLQENIINHAAPDEVMYDFKRDFEELKIDVAPEENEDFLRFKQIQERLKEADSVKEQGKEELYHELIEESIKQTEEIKQSDFEAEFIKRIDSEMQVIEQKEFIYPKVEIKERIPETKDSRPEPIIEEHIPIIKEYIPEVKEYPLERPIIDEPKIDEVDETNKDINQTGSVLEHFKELIDEKELISPVYPEIEERIPKVEEHIPEVKDYRPKPRVKERIPKIKEYDSEVENTFIPIDR